MLAVALGALGVVAGYCYAGSRFRTLGALWMVFTAGNVWLAILLLGSAVPWWCAGLIALFGGVPLVMLSVIVADLRFGLFPLDTFYGLIGVIVLTPAFYAVNLVLLGVV